MRSLLQLFAGLLDRVLAVVLAITAAQAPIYYAQYSQVLAGVRLEAEARYLELQQEARRLHMSVEAFVTRHEASGEPTFQASGRIHRNTLTRYRLYDTAFQALRSASPTQKPEPIQTDPIYNIDRSGYGSTLIAASTTPCSSSRACLSTPRAWSGPVSDCCWPGRWPRWRVGCCCRSLRAGAR